MTKVIANNNSLNINWSASMRKQEMDLEQERRYTTIYDINNEGSVDYLSSNKGQTLQPSPTKNCSGYRFAGALFSGVIIADKGFDKSRISPFIPMPPTACTASK